MTAALFDIQFGVSGDMLLGSLIDAGCDAGSLAAALGTLGLDGWTMAPEKTTRHAITGTAARISARDDHAHRTLGDIERILTRSGLSESSKERARRVFARLAEAEGRIHGIPASDVHFHEVGALDSIIDICAFCVALELMDIDTVHFGDFAFGTGTIQTRHGEIPVPVPAVVDLCNGFRGLMTGRSGELTTPTGAALLTVLGTQRSLPFAGTVARQGYGFGTRDYPFPSYTRVILMSEPAPPIETIVQMECSIDDMNPQLYPYVLERLFAVGALDAYLAPIHMKKGRPGMLLTVIAREDATERLREIVYRETTTLGIRYARTAREKIEREFATVTVKGCAIRIKIGKHNGEVLNIQPEYEDCKNAAEKIGIALKTVQALARLEYDRNPN